MLYVTEKSCFISKGKMFSSIKRNPLHSANFFWPVRKLANP